MVGVDVAGGSSGGGGGEGMRVRVEPDKGVTTNLFTTTMTSTAKHKSKEPHPYTTLPRLASPRLTRGIIGPRYTRQDQDQNILLPTSTNFSFPRVRFEQNATFPLLGIRMRRHGRFVNTSLTPCTVLPRTGTRELI